MKYFQLGIEHEEKPDRRIVEDRTDELVVRSKRRRRRFDLRQVVERKDHALLAVTHPVGQRVDLLHRHAVRWAEDARGTIRVFQPRCAIFVIGEHHFAFGAQVRVDLDIAGVARAVEVEREVIVVLGRIDLHPLGQAAEHIGKDRHRFVDRERLAARRHLGNVSLMGPQPWQAGILRGGCGHHQRSAERGHRQWQVFAEFDHHTGPLSQDQSRGEVIRMRPVGKRACSAAGPTSLQ